MKQLSNRDYGVYDDDGEFYAALFLDDKEVDGMNFYKIKEAKEFGKKWVKGGWKSIYPHTPEMWDNAE
jgi:hypothetical protein